MLADRIRIKPAPRLKPIRNVKIPLKRMLGVNIIKRVKIRAEITLYSSILSSLIRFIRDLLIITPITIPREYVERTIELIFTAIFKVVKYEVNKV